MAEVVGLAASVAGIVGITGQLLNGILSIKHFLDDTKDAPEDIRELSEEVELLVSAAQRTENLLVKCQRDGLELNLGEERKALKRYTDMISKLGAKIEKDVKKFSEGEGRWWNRVKTATKKNSLARYMVGIERAKTLILDVEMKIMVNLQHTHREVLNNASGSLQTLQCAAEGDKKILNQILVKSTATETWTESADVNLANLSTSMECIKNSLDGLAPAILQDRVAQQHELPGLENMIESAVMRGLQRHNDKLRTDQNPDLTKAALPNQTVIDSRGSIWKEHDNNITLRGSRSIHRTRFRTPLFDIEFVTKEALPRPVSWIQGLSTGHAEDLSSLQRFTTCRIRIQPLSWESELSLEPGSSNLRYSTGFHKCIQIRIYNIVPWDSPIIQACLNFDLPEVKRLFGAGYASPHDCTYSWSESLVAIVFRRLFSVKSITVAQATKAVELLKFLIHCLGGDIRFPGTGLFAAFAIRRRIGSNPHCAELGEKWTEAFRLGLAHSSEEPFGDRNIAMRFSIDFSQTPIYCALMAQQKWWVDTRIKDSSFHIDNRGHFFETDLQMLKDPFGVAMQEAITEGDRYAPYAGGFRPGAAHSPLHSLLKIAATTVREDLHQCVLARLSILLHKKHQLCNAYRVLDFSQSFFPGGYIPVMPLSCTGYANYLHLTNLWESALRAALWSSAEIQNLYDTDLYAGVPELLGGALVYQIREDQRTTFMHQLLRREFMNLVDGAILTLSIVLQNELGVWWAGVNQMIRDVDSCFKSRSIPGGWPTDQSRALVPGIDFKLPSVGEFDEESFEDVKCWKCVQEIWDKELDGCIPQDCSLPRKTYASARDYTVEKLRYARAEVRLPRHEMGPLSLEMVQRKTGYYS